MSKKDTTAPAVKAPATLKLVAIKPAKPLVLLVGTTAIEKAITSIKSAGTKLDAAIQVAGLSIIMHVDGCGDSTLADRLFNAMAKGSRRNALAEWLVTFGKMRVLDSKNKDDALAIKTGRIFQFEKTRKTDQAGAEAKPWFECKKEAAVTTTFDVQAEFAAFMKRVTAAQSAGKTMEHADIIEKLSKAMAA